MIRDIFYVKIMYMKAKALPNTLDSIVTFPMFMEAI
jgi:hypothetical protein